MTQRMHVLTNVVYGDPYFDIFTNLHLKSFLDPSNIPACKDRMMYHVFTDSETAPRLEAHDNFKKLKDTCKTGMTVFEWPAETQNRFQKRYGILTEMFVKSVAIACKYDAYLSAIVADLVCAKHFLPRIHDKMDAGYGAVFMLPLRATYESMRMGFHQVDGAMEANGLFEFAYKNLHPLWLACHWNNPLFTRLPFSMLWNTPTGVLARSFSVTPIIFNPTIHMMNAKQVIDVEIPAHCENIYWCENWTEAPIIGCEPLPCYYPPFDVKPSDADLVGNWAQGNLHPSQFRWIEGNFYYPDKKTANIPLPIQKQSDDVISRVSQYGGFLA